MAIMAGAALASAAGVGVGLVAVETVAMIGLVTTVVGAATGSKLLSKIGSGLSLGGMGAKVLGLGTAGASGTLGAAAAGTAGNTLIDPAAAAAQEAFGASLAQSGAAADIGMAGAADMAGNAIVESGLADVGMADLGTAGAASMPTQGPVLNTKAILGSAAPEAVTATTASSPSSVLLDGLKDAAKKIAAPFYAASPTVTPALESSSSWWEGFKDWWKDLDSASKLAVGQTAAGIVRGVGEGLMTMQAEDRKYDFLENERNYRRANMNYAPTFRITTTPGVVNSAILNG